MNVLTAWLFPARCFGCSKPDELFCRKCLSGLPAHSVSRAKFISAIFSASQYNNPALKSAIKSMKYRSGRKIAAVLGDFLAQALKANMTAVIKESPLVLAIPMSASRLRERGFNHSEFLSRTIAESLSLAFIPGALKKIRNTNPQAECRVRRERLENIRDSFGVNPNLDFRGKNILLVDDVSTTGATLNEAARALKEAGAARIYAAVVARG